MNAGSKTPDLQRHREALGGSRCGVSGRWSWLVALGVMALALALAPWRRRRRLRRGCPGSSPRRFPSRWPALTCGVLKASTRLPVGDAEPREHFLKWFLWAPGESPAELNAALLRRARWPQVSVA